jgi:hypothetical protein
MIRDVHPGSGSRIWILIFYPSRNPDPGPYYIIDMRHSFLRVFFSNRKCSRARDGHRKVRSDPRSCRGHRSVGSPGTTGQDKTDGQEAAGGQGDAYRRSDQRRANRHAAHRAAAAEEGAQAFSTHSSR